MEKMINLRDLLVHEVHDLYSAEEQIIGALPKMIEKAGNNQLKKALQDHLKVTEKQKDRLDEVKRLLLTEEENEKGNGRGLFGLFGGGAHKCKGTQGLIEEGEKIMSEDMTPEVLDAAIIASAQKIEHYEICGYGTARAYARELNLGDVAELLEETLNEEYEADDLLTDLAVGRLNEEAQMAVDDEEEGERSNRSARSAKSGTKSSSRNNSKPASRTAKKSSSKTPAKKSAGGRKTSRTASKTTSRSKSASGRSRSSRAKSR